MTDQFSALGEPFEIVSVRPAEPPPDMDGYDWHCYVIVQGINTIHGYRQGNLRAVTLNERRLGKRGRVNLVPTAKNKIDK